MAATAAQRSALILSIFARNGQISDQNGGGAVRSLDKIQIAAQSLHILEQIEEITGHGKVLDGSGFFSLGDQKTLS